MATPPVKFGENLKETEYSLQKDWIFLNHGSYGVVPKCIQEKHQRYLNELESHPERWYHRTFYEKYKKSCEVAAEFVGCDADDLVLVENATTGDTIVSQLSIKLLDQLPDTLMAMFTPDLVDTDENPGVNSVLKSYPFEEGDEILAAITTYGAVQQTCKHISEFKKGVKVHCLELKFPVESENQVIEEYREFMKSHPNIKIVILDHITSPSSLKMPITKLSALCKENNALCLVDGAHAPGQLPLVIRDLQDVDFYTGNLHKWCFVPRGCAILYVKKEHQSWCKPPVTSWFYGLGMRKEFMRQGTRDSTPYALVPDALAFFDRIGGFEALYRYNTDLLDKAVDMMVKAFNTGIFSIPKSMEAPFLRLVRLPKIPGYEATLDGSEKLYNDIADRFNIVCIVIPAFGDLYLRLSAQIYNNYSEYEKLRDVIVSMANKN